MNFRRLTILFFLFLLALNLASILGSNEWFVSRHLPLAYLVLVLVYLGISLAFAFFPCTGFHHSVDCRGKTTEKNIALTFDDGPDSRNTPVILEILEKKGVPAAFFCIGRRIEEHEAHVKAMHEQGHIVGNHSWSHSPWFDFFLPGAMARELHRTSKKIRELTGREPRMFRPPFGVINPMLSLALHGTGLKTVCWSIRSYDTVRRDHEKLTCKILDLLHPGAIILLHDHTAYTRESLESLIEGARQRGYVFVPLDKLLEIEAYA